MELYSFHSFSNSRMKGIQRIRHIAFFWGLVFHVFCYLHVLIRVLLVAKIVPKICVQRNKHIIMIMTIKINNINYLIGRADSKCYQTAKTFIILFSVKIGQATTTLQKISSV